MNTFNKPEYSNLLWTLMVMNGVDRFTMKLRREHHCCCNRYHMALVFTCP